MTTLSEPTPQTPDAATTSQTRLYFASDGTLRVEHPEHFRGEELDYPTEIRPAIEIPDADWATFLNLWWDTWPSQPVSLKALLAMAQDHHLFLAKRGNGNQRSQESRMGIFLRRNSGVLIQGFRLFPLGSRDRRKTGSRFVLVREKAKPPCPEEV